LSNYKKKNILIFISVRFSILLRKKEELKNPKFQVKMHSISKQDAIRSDGEKYIDFRKTLKPIYLIVWKDIALGYVAIGFFMSLSFFLEGLFARDFWMLIPIMSFIIGYCIAYLQLFCHEAIHLNIHPDKRRNDLIANVFLFSLVGKEVETCRKKHWQHHFNYGTVKDPENAYFNPLSNKLLFRILTGIYFIQDVLFQRIHEILKWKLNNRDLLKILMLAVGVTINLIIIVACIMTSHWQIGLVWLFALTIFFPLFSVVRQILEHRNEWADGKIDYSTVDHGKVARIFKDGFFSRTFGGAGFNRILLHQWDPNISYTRFDDLEEFLKDCPKCWINLDQAKTSYFDTYLWLIR
jgi:hypothetical protein